MKRSFNPSCEIFKTNILNDDSWLFIPMQYHLDRYLIIQNSVQDLFYFPTIKHSGTKIVSIISMQYFDFLIIEPHIVSTIPIVFSKGILKSFKFWFIVSKLIPFVKSVRVKKYNLQNAVMINFSLFQLYGIDWFKKNAVYCAICYINAFCI